MLKTRVIGVVLVRGGVAVQSIGFARHLPVGRPGIAVNYLDRWGIDEIVLLHIDPEGPDVPAGEAEVTGYARECQVPLSIGGGVRTLAQVQRIVHSGADKVVVNSALIETPALVEDVAKQFGSQCVVASIDARRDGGGHVAFTHGGRRATGIQAAELARRAEALGAGEILVNSIDRDGSKSGYDLDLVRSVAAAVGIPVIACGGAGHPDHMAAARRAGAAAVAAANFFHFTEHSVIVAKRALANAGESLRLDTQATYAAFELDADGRVAKADDARLEALRFQYIAEEVI